jgi:hypothetical protein
MNSFSITNLRYLRLQWVRDLLGDVKRLYEEEGSCVWVYVEIGKKALKW